MSHNKRCVDASTKINECDCDCKKMLHGVNEFRRPINFDHEDSVIEGALINCSDEFLNGVASNGSGSGRPCPRWPGSGWPGNRRWPGGQL